MAKPHKSYIEWQKELIHLVNSNNLIGFDANLVSEKKKIGEGGFGKVLLCQYKSLQLAMKKIKKHDPKPLLNEVTILKKYQHPMIPSFYGLLKHPEFYDNLVNFNAKLLQDNLESKKKGIKFNKQVEPDFDICLEYINGYSLEYFLRTCKLNEIEKYVILLNLATVLEYFHGFNLIHRDLKPENIMIDKSFKLKLLDFGISKIVNEEKVINTVSIGTIMYMAPENFDLLTIVVDSKEHSDDSDKSEEEDKGLFTIDEMNRGRSNISDKVDIWAFGCILHEMFTGIRPWKNKVNDEKKIMALLYSKKTFEIDKKMEKCSKLRTLIERCVELDPSKRANIKEVKTRLLEIFYERIQSLINFTNGIINLAELTLRIYSLLPNINIKEKYQVIVKIQAYIFDYYRVLTKEKKGVPRFLFDFIKRNNKRKSIITLLNALVLREIDECVEKEKNDKALQSQIEMEELEKKKKILSETKLRKNGKPLRIVQWHPDTLFIDMGEKILRSPRQRVSVINVDSKKMGIKKKLTISNKYDEGSSQLLNKENIKNKIQSVLGTIGFHLKNEIDYIQSKLLLIPIKYNNIRTFKEEITPNTYTISEKEVENSENTPDITHKAKNDYMKIFIEKQIEREKTRKDNKELIEIANHRNNINDLNFSSTVDVNNNSNNLNSFDPFKSDIIISNSNLEQETLLNPIVESLTSKIYDEMKKNEAQFNKIDDRKTNHNEEVVALSKEQNKTLPNDNTHANSMPKLKAKKTKYHNDELKRVLEVNIYIDNIRQSFVNMVDRRSNLISKMKRLNNLRNSSEIKKSKKDIENNIIRILPENSPYLKKLFVSKGSEYNKISNNFIKEINRINPAKSEKNLIKTEEKIEKMQDEISKSPLAVNTSKNVLEENSNKKNMKRSNSHIDVKGLPKISNSYKNLHSDKSFLLNEVHNDEAKRLNSFIPVQDSRESSTKIKLENFNFYKFKAKMNELLYPDKHKEIETIRKYSPLYNKQIKNLIKVVLAL